MTDQTDGWVAMKERWLWWVATEIRQWTPLAIAVRLAHHFNSQSHRAWMSPATLASELKMKRRNVQHALKVLVTAGLLDREGRHYSIPDTLLTRQGASDGMHPDASQGASDGMQGVHLTGCAGASDGMHNKKNDKKIYQKRGAASQPRVALRRPPSEKKSRQSFEFKQRTAPAKHKTAPAQRNSGGAAPRRAVAVSLVLTEEMIATAQRIAGWDPATTQYEFEKYTGYLKETGKAMSWDRWCQRGRDYDKQQVKKQKPTQLEQTHAAVESWKRRRRESDNQG
jgi:hypothetical protein